MSDDATSDDAVLGTGAQGDPAKPGLSQAEYEETVSEEKAPADPPQPAPSVQTYINKPADPTPASE